MGNVKKKHHQWEKKPTAVFSQKHPTEGGTDERFQWNLIRSPSWMSFIKAARFNVIGDWLAILCSPLQVFVLLLLLLLIFLLLFLTQFLSDNI